MRPRQQKKSDHDDLFKARLDQIINLRHELVILANKIDWAWFDEQIAPISPSTDDQGSRFGL
jgi:IS5 family transposase